MVFLQYFPFNLISCCRQFSLDAITFFSPFFHFSACVWLLLFFALKCTDSLHNPSANGPDQHQVHTGDTKHSEEDTKTQQNIKYDAKWEKNKREKNQTRQKKLSVNCAYETKSRKVFLFICRSIEWNVKIYTTLMRAPATPQHCKIFLLSHRHHMQHISEEKKMFQHLQNNYGDKWERDSMYRDKQHPSVTWGHCRNHEFCIISIEMITIHTLITKILNACTSQSIQQTMMMMTTTLFSIT